MNIKINWSQPSTWRGAVMLVSGLTTGLLTVFGYSDHIDQVNGLVNMIMGIISGGMATSGAIGVFNNDQK